jgi:hypothetical protein
VVHSGDKVFYCDNASDYAQYARVAIAVIHSLGLVPVPCRGGLNSNPTTKIVDDFYLSKVAVIRLGLPNPADNWALREYSPNKIFKIPFLIYASTTSQPMGLSCAPVLVANEVVFETRLRRDLENLLAI